MSIIKRSLIYQGSQAEKRLYTLFDSGSSHSCIHPDFVSSLGNPEALGVRRKMETANEGQYITVTERIALDFYIDDILLSDEFLVVPSLSEEVIIGAATLQKWRIKLDFERDEVIVDPRVARNRI
ncbi:MAG: retropepsin-like domain-containing protein [Chitinophagaceae bacterium]|nr:retropepsin-like domain-containing protein [Chitinophagaceae bacterium]